MLDGIPLVKVHLYPDIWLGLWVVGLLGRHALTGLQLLVLLKLGQLDFLKDKPNYGPTRFFWNYDPLHFI